MMRHDRNEPTNERLDRYAEAIDAHAEAESEHGYNRWRCTCGEVIATGRKVRALAALRDHQARAVMAVADAEQAELRAEVERLRGWYADARAVLGNMDRLITEANSRSDLAQAEVAHWKNHAGEAGRGFTQVCQDAARTAARNTELARLREADVLRAEAAEAEVERLRAEIRDRESERADLRDRVQKAESAPDPEVCIAEGCGEPYLHAFVYFDGTRIHHLEARHE